MGTSNANGGQGGDTPLVPSWLPPDGPPAPPPASSSSAAGGASRTRTASGRHSRTARPSRPTSYARAAAPAANSRLRCGRPIHDGQNKLHAIRKVWG